ncbi:hypothetical protein OGAPHI_007286 [Ogataea philodendri]|uniref:Protein kinase domain-containing protein n=1 Tax=Ogataea philodendri TaxID=1378263 RepID=A0A9P8T003_9ASCO|nr:uncharacterized protein OGAPHI_007286 [Ogataea philodendri]KAH3660081.1 hypothetical protein OGAPHI_007286 [Ogataea philodendri]
MDKSLHRTDYCYLMPLFFPRKYGHRERELGTGTTATVSLYTHKQRYYAVKVISRDDGESRKDHLARVHKEVEIHRALGKHINVVDFVEFFVVNRRPYYVEEFLPISVSFVRPVQDLESRLCLFKQLVHALDYLQKQNISHRDVKLANCRLTKGGILKIIDFGSSIYGNEGIGVAGSKGMVAPEVLRNLRYDSFLSDVWSLGVVFVELMGQKTKWKEALWNDPAFEQYTKTGNVDQVAEHMHEFSGLVLAMLQINPQMRIALCDLLKTEIVGQIKCCGPANALHSH